MVPVILLYAAAGALMTGGVLGGAHVMDVAQDRAATERVRRRLREERALITEALATKEVRDEAARRGLDLASLQAEVAHSRTAQDQLLQVLQSVLAQHGTTAEAVRRLLEP